MATSRARRRLCAAGSALLSLLATAVPAAAAPDIYAVDQRGDELIGIGPNGAQTDLAHGDKFSSPAGVAIMPNGDPLVVDPGAGLIRVNRSTGDQTVWASSPTFVSPNALALEPDGDAIVVDSGILPGTSAISRVDSVTRLATPLPAGALIRDPRGVAVGAG